MREHTYLCILLSCCDSDHGAREGAASAGFFDHVIFGRSLITYVLQAKKSKQDSRDTVLHLENMNGASEEQQDNQLLPSPNNNEIASSRDGSTVQRKLVERANVIDKIARIFFPLTFFTFCIVFMVFYMY